MAFSDHNLTLLANIPPAFQPRYRVVSWGCSFCFHAVALTVAAVLLRELPKAPTPVYRMEILLSDPQAVTDQATPSDPQGEADPATPPETTAFTEDSSPVVPSPSPSIRSASSEMVEQQALSEPSIVQRRVPHVTPATPAQQTTALSSPASDPGPIGNPMPIKQQIETVAPVNESYRPASVFSSEAIERSEMTPAAQMAAPPATETIAKNFNDHAELSSPHSENSYSSPLTNPAPMIDSQTGSSGSPTASSTETVAMNHSATAQIVPTKSQYGWLAELLRRRTMSLLAYPHLARMQGLEGIVVVKTTINSDGSLVDAVVTKSSGYGALDEDALKLMHRVCPIRLSQDLGKPQITVSIPIRYRLDKLE